MYQKQNHRISEDVKPQNSQTSGQSYGVQTSPTGSILILCAVLCEGFCIRWNDEDIWSAYNLLIIMGDTPKIS